MFWLTKKGIDVIKSQLIESSAENPYISLSFDVKGQMVEMTIKIKEWHELSDAGCNPTTLKQKMPSWVNAKAFAEDAHENGYWLSLTAFIACCEAIKGEKYIKIESSFNYDTKCTRFEISGIKSEKKCIVNRKWTGEEGTSEEED